MRQTGVAHLERGFGSDRLDVRVGAIGALERVMIDSATDPPFRKHSLITSKDNGLGRHGGV